METHKFNDGSEAIKTYTIVWKGKWTYEEKMMYLAQYANTQQDVYLDENRAKQRCAELEKIIN